ncbi:ABCA6 protein, partial [Eudromia elegans]|nr:ABCA6 protein [Eudromia elegans]
MCSAEPINCFPVLVNILSNTFLRLFNSTEHIRIWSDPFPHTRSPAFMQDIFYRCLVFTLLLIAGLPSHFAMTSMDDYKVKIMH